MPGTTSEQTVRWSVRVSRDIDRRARAHLRKQGIDKGGLSKFVEEAVRWQVLDGVVQEVKARNAARDPGEMQSMIDEAVAEVRAERRGRKRA